MSSIAINQTVELAVLKMMTSNTEDIVTKLAEKYGFDAKEALELTLPKEVVKKEVVPRKSKGSPKAEPKSTKGKGKDKEDKPKKAKTGYLLFSDSVRAEVRAELEEAADEGTKVMAKEVVRGIATKWKELSVEEQSEWKTIAEEAKSPPESEHEEEAEEAEEAEE
jgi:hypothetical protein